MRRVTVLLWEEVKSAAIYQFKKSGRNRLLFQKLLCNAHCKIAAESIEEDWIEYGVNLIKCWNVRDARHLIDVFPIIVEHQFRGERLIPSMDSKLVWSLRLSPAKTHAVLSETTF